MFYHGFRTWWISRTLLLETDDLVEVAGKQTFLETPGVKRCFFRLINLLTFISICLLNFCTPLSCNSLLEIQRSSYQCDSLIQRCSLKKLFLNFQIFRSTQVFSCEYCNIFKSNYFEEHLPTSASEARTNQKWNLRKQVLCKYPQIFIKTHRKTLVPESLF